MSTKVWVVLSTVVAIFAILENVEVGDEEILITSKSVALVKSRAKIFQLLADLRTYPEWFPNVLKFEATDTAPMSIGKHFIDVEYVPLYGEVAYEVVVTGYESPRYVSFLQDTWMQLRTEIELERRDSDMAPTLLHYRLYSRKKSILFRYGMVPWYSVITTSKVRQALLNLKFVFQK